jgi:hypothetical protein
MGSPLPRLQGSPAPRCVNPRSQTVAARDVQTRVSRVSQFLDTRRDGDYKIWLMNCTIPAEQANRTAEVLPDLLSDPQGSNSLLASCLFSGMLVGAVGIEPTFEWWEAVGGCLKGSFAPAVVRT